MKGDIITPSIKDGNDYAGKQILVTAIEIQKEIGDNHAFFLEIIMQQFSKKQIEA